MEKYNLTQTGQEVQNILDNAIPQSDLAEEVERAQEAEGALQGNIDAEEIRAKAAEKQNADDIDAIEEKIPSAASSENQLADKSFVNSSIATATATFRGTFNLVSDLHLTLDATEQQIATALALAIDTADNNDYCFLQVPTSVDTPTVIGSVDRYKFNGSSWAYEYTLNNSGYTQAQWNAINSGITSGDVTKLEALPTNAQLTTLLNGKQNVLTFDNAPTRNSDNPVKSSGVFNSIEAILALIPSAASVVNQLADKAFVNSSIATATATFRGTYNLVIDLDLTISATYSDIASALADVVSGADNNDYAFVQIPTSDTTPTQIAKTVRFKFNGTSWEYEYDLNNSGYTAAQWAAINSGITAALVAKLDGLPTADALQLALNVITQDIDNLEAVVPTEATSSNQLADKAFVLNEILLATPAFKGQFTTLAQLQAVTGAKTGDMGIVRTKDHDGKDVFMFYQYKDDQWNELYTLAYHPQDKPATTGIIGDYPYNGMGRIELPMNLVDGWPNDTWLYLPVNGVVYLLYSWNLQLYAVYNSGSSEGLGLENNIIIEPASYDISDIADLVGSRYLSYTEAGGVFTITKPDTTTITSTVLNNTTIYKEDDTDHHGINLLTQSMLNRPNTVYVIQYDFTLGEDITVPANCVLEFDGGSLSGNGAEKNTITSDDLIIVSENKCFSNIKFVGKCTNSNFNVKWWISQYPSNTDDYSVDNTNELQDAFSSGALSFVFPSDRFFCITNTLSYTGNAKFLLDKEVYDSHGTLPLSNMRGKSTPCIFTKDVITMLDYTYERNNQCYTSNLYIGNLAFVNFRNFSNTTEKDIPIIKITANTCIFDSKIKCCVRGDEKLISNKNEVSYTGIKVIAHDYIDTITFDGSVLLTYYAYNISKDADTYFNFITINGSTWCNVGCIIPDNGYNMYPLNVFGSHQARSFTQDNDGTAYFKAARLNLYGHVWDINQNNNGLLSVKLPYTLLSLRPWYNTPTNNVIDCYEKVSIQNFGAFNPYKRDCLYPNVLKEALNPTTSWIVSAFSCNICKNEGGSITRTSAFNNSNVLHIHNIFSDKIPLTSGNDNITKESKVSAFYNASLTISDYIEYSFNVNMSYIVAKYMYLKSDAFNLDVTLKNGDSVVDHFVVNRDDNYSNTFSTLCVVNLKHLGDNTITFMIKATPIQNYSYTVMPYICIPLFGEIENRLIAINTSIYGLPNMFSGHECGETILATDLGKPIYYNGTAWVDATGTPV